MEDNLLIAHWFTNKCDMSYIVINQKHFLRLEKNNH